MALPGPDGGSLKANRRILIDGIDSEAMFRFPHVIRAAAHALQPPRMVLGFMAVLFLITMGSIYDALTAPAALPAGLLSTHASDLDAEEIDRFVRLRLTAAGLGEQLEDAEGLLDVSAGIRMLDRAARAKRADLDEAGRERFRQIRAALSERKPVGRFAGSMADIGADVRAVSRATLQLNTVDALLSVRRLLIDLPSRNWNESRGFVIFMIPICIITWAGIGGAVSRIAACDLAGGERIGVRDAMAFGVRRFSLLAGAIVFPCILVGLLIALMALPALLLTVPVLNVLVGMLWIVVLIAGLFAAFLIFVGVPGLPLLVPAVACEHCDPVDALQRVCACILRRPLHFVFYWVIWLAGLLAGCVLIGLFVALVVRLPAMLAAVFSGAIVFAADAQGGVMIDPIAGWSGKLSAGFVSFWGSLVALALPAWIFSYLAGGWTAVYLVLRRASDGRDIDEIWRPTMISGTTVSAESPSAHN